MLDYLYRPPFHRKVFSLPSSSASFVIFSMHVRYLLITHGSVLPRFEFSFETSFEWKRCNFPPLHLPSDKLILRKGQPLTQQVFNYRSFMKNWSRTASVKCACNQSHSGYKNTAVISGHLMCAAAEVIPNSCLATANLADTTYFSKNKWRATTLRTLQIWCKHWKLPSQVSERLPRWVDQQWELHQETVQSSGNATWDPQAVAQASRLLRALVLGPAGHFPNSLFIACPVHYHKLLCKTFGDPAVFQPCKNGTATIIQQDVENQHPDLQVYDWAFQWNKGLPNARILPKGSKQFAKARPIIAYTKCWHTKASSFLATALYSIMQTLFPKGSALNVNSVMSALQRAWKQLQHMDPRDEEQVMIQQDLIGFFNSVPHSRICSALQLMLCRVQEHFGQTADELVFQVDHQAGTRDLRIFKGQRRFRASNTTVLQIRHVMELTEFLLQSAYFKVGIDTYCQIQGACMGSPLAPVLCAMVAAEQECLTIRS